jgi:hypothetical protein
VLQGKGKRMRARAVVGIVSTGSKAGDGAGEIRAEELGLAEMTTALDWDQ